MTASENIALVQQNYAAFGRGDWDTVRYNFAPDIVWESRYIPGLPMHGTYHGIEQVMQFFQMLHETTIVQAYVPQRFLAQDNMVVALGYEHVTTKLTGNSYRNDWVHIWMIRDNKLAKYQSFNDVASTAAAFATA